METEKLMWNLFHVLSTSNRTCSVPYGFFLKGLSSQTIGYEAWLLLQTQQCGNTQGPACYQSAIIAKGLINCLSLNNE